ncbi:MAG: 3-hydroxyacyl-CoA dehydrogenase family protein [Thermoguttaceae bacterium]|nr:3-hydroxyacyl-CoA dehydrogenase family protein [Thermoguttaceae bacterium]
MSDDRYSVFSPVLPASGLSPEEYVRGFQLGFVDDAPFDAADALAATLYKERNAGAPRVSKRVDFKPDAVGIAGAGLMGVSIAASFLGAGVRVVLYDPFAPALESAKERLRVEYATQRARQGLASSDDVAERALVAGRVDELVQTTDSLDRLAELPVVVESIPEKLKLKAKLYRELAGRATAPILLLTNTSSLRVSELAASLSSDPGAFVSRTRFMAFHFFHPVARRNLVEIAPCEETAQDAIDQVAALGRAIGKIPIVVGDGPGLLVNRLLQAYLNEALKTLDAGVAPERLEAICLKTGMEGAPLRVIDEIGVDVSLHAGWSFFKAFPDRTHRSPALENLVRDGKLGRKTKLGFYRYESTRSWADDAALCYEERSESTDRANWSDEQIATSIFESILDEAGRIVDDKIARTYREVDAGLVLALGFPASKGGVCYWGAVSGRLS